MLSHDITTKMDRLNPVKLYFKQRNFDISSWTFKVLTRLNVSFLLMFALLLLAREIFGDPIDCGGGRGSITKSSIESFCWVMGIYVQKGFTGMFFLCYDNAKYIVWRVFHRRYNQQNEGNWIYYWTDAWRTDLSSLLSVVGHDLPWHGCVFFIARYYMALFWRESNQKSGNRIG